MKTKKTDISNYIKLFPKQQEALQHVGTGERLFFGGARGGGKSRFSLIAAILVALQYPGITIVAIRRKYSELEEVFIQQLKLDYPEPIFMYKYKEKHRMAIFANTSRILFRACDTESDAEKIQGIEFQLMIIDEANNFEEITLQKLTGSLRKSNRKLGMKNFLPSLIMTGNPGGRSDLYFKHHYINPDYRYWNENELKHRDKYIFIQSKVADNPAVGEEYVEMLEALPHNLKEAWLYGNWNVFHGQFFEEWESSQHVIKSFEIPPDWERKSGMDMGFTDKHPTVFLWAAQDPETQDIHIYREAVLTGDLESQASIIADYQKNETMSMQVADPSMWDDTTKNKIGDDSAAFLFLRQGIPLIPADNSRINGWRIVKQWMHWTRRKPPKLKVHDNCPMFIEAIPTLKYNVSNTYNLEDLDTRQKYDDFADALRYLLKTCYHYPVNKYDEGYKEMTVENVQPNKNQRVQHKERAKSNLSNEEIMARFKSHDNYIDERIEESSYYDTDYEEIMIEARY